MTKKQLNKKRQASRKPQPKKAKRKTFGIPSLSMKQVNNAQRLNNDLSGLSLEVA